MNIKIKEKKISKKIVALVMTVAMLFSVLGGMATPAFAKEETGNSLVTSAGWDGKAATAFAGGTGTEADPYIIATGGQLAYLASNVNKGNTFADKHIKLTDDINLNNQKFTPIGGGAKLGDGTATYKFKGIFDGSGNKIYGMNVNTTGNFTGLFGYNGGVIKNLTVDGSVTCLSNELSSTSAEPSSDFVGSVVGFNCGTIVGVISNVALTATRSGHIGGIAGFNTSGLWVDNTEGKEINRSISGATGLIENCGNNGAIKAYKKIGGITGENAGTISKSYNKGQVKTVLSGKGNGIAGIAGRNGNNNAPYETGIIANCYNRGEIGPYTGNDARWMAGISGFSNNYSYLINCYTTGNVIKGYKDWYPLSARMDMPAVNVLNSYSLDTLVGCDQPSSNFNSYYGIQKTGAYMQSAAFTADLGGGYVADTSSLNDGYPIFRWETGANTNVSKIEMTSNPTKTTYVAGEKFSVEGMMITATFDNGATEKLTGADYKISKTEELNEADKSVTVSGTFGGESFSFDINITVAANQLDSIRISNLPNKMAYETGSEFDGTGMEITAVYTNGKTEELKTGFTFDDKILATGSNKIKVSYTYKSVTKTDGFSVKAIDLSQKPIKDEKGIYNIASAAQLQAFSDMVSKLGMTDINGKLTTNIDATGIDLEPIGAEETEEIETDNGKKLHLSNNFAYRGTFDGEGNSLKVKIESKEQAGLFGILGSAKIKNIVLEGTVIGGENTRATGGIAAALRDDAVVTVSGCINNANIEAKNKSNIGGILGSGESGSGAIVNCKNTGTVEGKEYAGGIIGKANSVTIENCVNNGNVTGTGKYTGGVAGSTGAKVTKAGNTGIVTGTEITGGVIGNYTWANGTADNLYNKGAVKGAYTVGGIYGTGYIGTTVNCYNLGNITATGGAGEDGVGGLIGTQGSSYTATVTNCYNAGTVKGENGVINTGSLLGYIKKNGTFTNTFYLTGSGTKAVGGSDATAVIKDNTVAKSQEELSGSAGILGAAFEKGADYPQLAWDWEDWYAGGKIAGAINLGITASTYNSIKLSWNQISAADGYEIYRATSAAGNYTLVAKTANPFAVTFTQKALTCGTTYYYKVRACTSYVTSEGIARNVYGKYSAVKSAKPIPGKPTIKVKAGKRSITTSWSKIKEAGNYQVSISTSKSKTAIKKTLSANKSNYKKTKLKKGKRYYIKVRVYRTVNKKKIYGNWSTIKSIKAK